MEVKQIYEFVNQATEQALGQSGIVAEDLSNVVEVGTTIFNANAMDAYVKALVNRIGQTIFVNRVYEGSAPSVMMDGWEYGSVMQKICMALPEAQENDTWALVDGKSYDPHVFNQPSGVQAKYFNKSVTFEIDISFTEEQIKQSFNSATEMNGFISMIYTQVENSMTVKYDELIRRTINNMIVGSVFMNDSANSAYWSEFELATGKTATAVNLLEDYNAEYDASLTAEEAIHTPEFVRYAAYRIKLTYGRMKTMSNCFNLGDQPRHTPKDLTKIVLLEDFASAADVYLQSDTFHNELTALPDADRVSYWQGSGTAFEFSDCAKVKARAYLPTATGASLIPINNVEVPYVLGVMFDRWALGVTNYERKVTSEYTSKAEFYTNFYKFKASYFNDFNENFVVFYMK